MTYSKQTSRVTVGPAMHLAAVAVLATAVVSGATPVAAQTTLQRSGFTNIPDGRELAQFGLVRQWFGQASFDPTSDSLASITADESAVYVVSRGGYVSAFDSETGGRRWSARLGSESRPVQEPTSNGGLVIFAVGRSLIALDKANGNSLWELKLEAIPSSGPSADEENVYVGFENGGVSAYNLDDIRRLYDEGRLPDFSYNALAWNYRTSRSISSSPQSDGETVSFASRSGVYYSVTANSRQLRFLFEGAGPIVAPFTRERGMAVIPCDDLNVYCVNDATGAVRWTLVTGLPVHIKPLVVGDRVFLSPNRGGTLAVDLDDGRRIWQQRRAAEVVASSGSRLYAKSTLGQLMTLDAATGAVLAMLPVSGFEQHVVNERTDRIFMASSRGSVLCLRDRDRVFPAFHREPEKAPLLPEHAANGPDADAE